MASNNQMQQPPGNQQMAAGGVPGGMMQNNDSAIVGGWQCQMSNTMGQVSAPIAILFQSNNVMSWNADQFMYSIGDGNTLMVKSADGVNQFKYFVQGNNMMAQGFDGSTYNCSRADMATLQQIIQLSLQQSGGGGGSSSRSYTGGSDAMNQVNEAMNTAPEGSMSSGSYYTDDPYWEGSVYDNDP